MDLWLIVVYLCRQTNRVGPAGSIVSNAVDMSKWLQFHLNGGMTSSGVPLVSKEMLMETYRERMMSPSSRYEADTLRHTYPVSDVHIGYDMGWMTNVYRGKAQ